MNPDSHDQDRIPTLERFGNELMRVARKDGRRSRSRRLWRVTAAIASAAVAIPVGFAVADSAIDSGPEPIPASECPEANAVYEKYGFPMPDEYSPDCPDPKEIQANIEANSLPNEVIQQQEASEPEGSWSQNLDKVDEFREEFRQGPQEEELQQLDGQLDPEANQP